jgi:hypothetical protein
MIFILQRIAGTGYKSASCSCYGINVDGKVIFGEVKDGMGAKLSKAQQAVYKAAIESGHVVIVNKDIAKALKVDAGKTLFAQGVRVGVTLDAAIGSRAARQWVRTMGPIVGKGLAGAATILGSPAVLGADLFLHTSEAH